MIDPLLDVDLCSYYSWQLDDDFGNLDAFISIEVYSLSFKLFLCAVAGYVFLCFNSFLKPVAEL